MMIDNSFVPTLYLNSFDVFSIFRWYFS